jgi:ubiquinone/menaquinone biosynthesis C-methylase UbiE
VATAASPGELRYRERCIDKLGFSFQGDERLLDVGCGDGGVAGLLRRRVGEVVGVDVEPSSEWEDADGLSYRVADGEQLPFADAEFDLIHSKDSLHHMLDPVRALAEYHRVLKPGGTALIVEGNRYNPVFFVHMTKLLGHEHFPQRYFRSIVRGSFPNAFFGVFEAHYAPIAERPRVRKFQHAVEETLERLPGLGPVLSYNYAVAPRA